MNDVERPAGVGPVGMDPVRLNPGDKPDVAPAKAARVEDLVEQWWRDHFPGSPVAQVTAMWNHAFAAKDELKRRLIAFAASEGK